MRLVVAILCALLATSVALSQEAAGGSGSARGMGERPATGEAASAAKLGSGAASGAGKAAGQKAEQERLTRERDVPVDLGQGTEGTGAANALRPPGFGATLFGAVLNLGLVIGLIYAVYWVARVIRKERPRARSGGHLIQVLESARLGPDRSIHVVTIGARVLMVGSSPGGLSLLAEIDDEEVTRAATSGAGRSGFAEELALVSDDEGATPPGPDWSTPAPSGPSGRAAAALNRAAGLLGSLSRRGGRR